MRRCQADFRKPSFLCASARVEAGDEEGEPEVELERYGEVSCWRLGRTDGRTDRQTDRQTPVARWNEREGLLIPPDIHDPLRSLIAQFIRQHLQYRPLVSRQVLRHRDLKLDAQIARRAPPATELAHAHAAERELVAGPRTRSDLNLDLAVQRRDPRLAAQRRGRERDRSRVEDIGAGATELGVRRDADEDVEIARLRARAGVGGGAGGSGVAVAGEAQAHAVLDAAGDVDLDLLALADDAVAGTRGALAAAGDGDALAAAGVARAGHLEAGLHEVDSGAGAAALLARRALRAFLDPGAGARLACHQRGDPDVLGRPLGGVHEGHVRLHFDVLPD